MEIKYTKDGKKVVVIGKINQTEYIVQEIFVTKNGDEIPSGENFTAKSLHDEPLEAWKPYTLRNEERMAAQLEAKRKKLEADIRNMENRLATMKDVFSFSSKLASNDKLADKLKMLNSFASGRCRYALMNKYDIEIVDLFSEIECSDSYWGERKHEGIKLVSLFGSSDGDIQFRISRYGDGSGCSIEIEFYETKEEVCSRARELALVRMTEGKASLKTIRKLMSQGVDFTDAELRPLIEKHRAELESNIRKVKEDAEKSLKTAELKLKEFEGEVWA